MLTLKLRVFALEGELPSPISSDQDFVIVVESAESETVVDTRPSTSSLLVSTVMVKKFSQFLLYTTFQTTVVAVPDGPWYETVWVVVGTLKVSKAQLTYNFLVPYTELTVCLLESGPSCNDKSTIASAANVVIVFDEWSCVL